MQKFLLFSSFFLSSHLMYAQEGRTVTGHVSEASGSALPGVNVLLKGTAMGTTTDADGRYSIVVPDNGILVFSFIGYETVELPLRGQTVLDVSLAPAVQTLGEIVVVGYGTENRRCCKPRMEIHKVYRT